MKLKSFPFHIGPTDKPENLSWLPNTYPFEVVFDSLPGMLVQPCSFELKQVLRAAYEVGQNFGTPLAEDNFGKPYAEDFLDFIEANQPDPQRGLEIGAGVQINSYDKVRWTVSSGVEKIEYGSVRISDNCYLGPSVVISQGITIGNQCVIEANSFVNRDVPGGMKACGAPARPKGVLATTN